MKSKNNMTIIKIFKIFGQFFQNHLFRIFSQHADKLSSLEEDSIFLISKSFPKETPHIRTKKTSP